MLILIFKISTCFDLAEYEICCRIVWFLSREACFWNTENRVEDFLILHCFYLQMKPVECVIFSDYGTDLGSGSTVPGRSSFHLYYFLDWNSFNLIDLLFWGLIFWRSPRYTWVPFKKEKEKRCTWVLSSTWKELICPTLWCLQSRRTTPSTHFKSTIIG